MADTHTRTRWEIAAMQCTAVAPHVYIRDSEVAGQHATAPGSRHSEWALLRAVRPCTGTRAVTHPVLSWSAVGANPLAVGEVSL